MRFRIQLAFVCTALLCLILTGCDAGKKTVSGDPAVAAVATRNPAIWPAIEKSIKYDPVLEHSIKQLLNKMTVAEKVGQILQPELRSITPADVKAFHIGSILNGGGAFPNNNKYASASEWVATADAFYYASMDDSDGGVAIPVIWGTDAVHGHNNVVGATLFPHNIGLGAANNPKLIRNIARATAIEVAATGLDWIFAPTVATVRNDFWGRTYEGFSEDPEIVKAYAGMFVEGMQGKSGTSSLLDSSHIVSTAKHFIGDGGTDGGVDRGNNLASEQDLFDLHAQGYISAIEAGVQTVMVSFNSWQGEPLHGHRYLITDILKGRMGFDGLVVGDWNGHSFVEGCSSDSCPQAFNAGIDLLMAPESDWKDLYHNTLAQVRDGTISTDRLDNAVTRILRVKLRAGLFEGPPSSRPLAGKDNLIGSQPHRDIARQAVRESLVLLKNKNQLLPLNRNINVLVAGDGADNIAKQSGGWTLSWQGTGNTNKDFPGATSIYAGIAAVVNSAGGEAVLSPKGSYSKRPDVAIVVYGEDPYAEGHGDINTLEYKSDSHALLKKLKADGIPVVSIFISGRPLWVNRELNASDAFVAAWLPGSEGAGIAEVIFKAQSGEPQHDMVGSLSFSWPKDISQVLLNRGDADYQPLFPYGYGLSYGAEDDLSDALPENILDTDNKSASHTLPALTLFNRRAIAPWELVIKDKQGTATSFSGDRVENSSLLMVAVDRLSQEDSRQVTWQEDKTGSVALTSNTLHDLSPYLTASSVLSLTLRLTEPPTGPLLARIECGEGCAGDVDISEKVAVLKPGEWEKLTVDLACFANNKVDFRKVNTPLSLVTEGRLDLAFSGITYQPNWQGPVDIDCSSFNEQ